jgi:hypothetical protein
MKLSNLTFIAVALCAGTINWSISIARADELLKFRAFMHATSAQALDVGDVDGHALGLARVSGLASFPDGSVGTVYVTATNDYIKGAGTNLVYYNLSLKDGSVLSYRVTGTAKVDGTTTIFPEAQVSVLSGKGRFEGAKGDGTVSGARLAPFGTPGAEIYQDFAINVKK